MRMRAARPSMIEERIVEERRRGVESVLDVIGMAGRGGEVDLCFADAVNVTGWEYGRGIG